MIVKIDLVKAYDSLSWQFTKDTLKDIKFSSKLVNVIVDCVTSTVMNILWNGEITYGSHIERGIRQGYLLFPYLSMLCVERLEHLIREQVTSNK